MFISKAHKCYSSYIDNINRKQHDKQAAIKRLIDQVCILHQQLSFLAFKIKGNYLKLGCSLSEQINAEFQTSLLLYSLIG
jgi:hypothetical protein